MTYCEIVKTSPRGGEKGMWDGVRRVSDFLEKMREEHPHEVKCFLKEEYIAMNGKHINAGVANRLVSEMYHTDKDKKVVKGELVPIADSQELVSGMDDEWSWDAYVAANAMMHDLANTGMGKKDIMEIAKHFYFHDEDFSDDNKVFWYFEWMIF